MRAPPGGVNARLTLAGRMPDSFTQPPGDSWGGSDEYDFQGACVADALVLNGHFNFHYDENLKRRGPTR